MRSYFIVPKHIAQGHGHFFLNSHWANIPNSDDVILSVVFRSDEKEERFNELKYVKALPHFLDSSPITDEHLPKLKHLGIKKGHTTKDLKKALKVKGYVLM